MILCQVGIIALACIGLGLHLLNLWLQLQPQKHINVHPLECASQVGFGSLKMVPSVCMGAQVRVPPTPTPPLETVQAVDRALVNGPIPNTLRQ